MEAVTDLKIIVFYQTEARDVLNKKLKSLWPWMQYYRNRLSSTCDDAIFSVYIFFDQKNKSEIYLLWK